MHRWPLSMSASPNAHTMNPHVTQSLGQLVAAEGALEESGQVLQVTVTDVDGGRLEIA